MVSLSNGKNGRPIHLGNTQKSFIKVAGMQQSWASLIQIHL
jgi:hypothetical protein